MGIQNFSRIVSKNEKVSDDRISPSSGYATTALDKKVLLRKLFEGRRNNSYTARKIFNFRKNDYNLAKNVDFLARSNFNSSATFGP